MVELNEKMIFGQRTEGGEGVWDMWGSVLTQWEEPVQRAQTVRYLVCIAVI